jgi:hypothetical protein
MSLTGIGFEDDGKAFASFKWTEIATTFSDEWGPNILANLRAEAPVAPGGGRLRDALSFERRTRVGTLTMIFSDPGVPYFGYVISGTQGGQLIQPIAARALHWQSGGADFFASQVTRGSTPKNDFPTRVWARMQEEVQSAFRDAIREGLTT